MIAVRDAADPNASAKNLQFGHHEIAIARKQATSVADLVKGRIRYKDAKLPEIVHDYLLRSYPPKDVEWALDPDIDWEYDPHVDLGDINMARRPGGRDPEKVQSIADTLGNGASMDPMVFVQFDTPNPNGLVIADGWHRTLGSEKAGWKDVPAFVGRDVPDQYQPIITGAMQDDSDSKKKVEQAELAVLRRFIRKGGSAENFRTDAIRPDVLEKIVAEAGSTDVEDLLDRARMRLEGLTLKDFSLSSPLSTGLVPYDLDAGERPATCPTCGKPLTDGPHDHGSVAAPDLTLLAAIDAELDRRGILIEKRAGANQQIGWEYVEEGENTKKGPADGGNMRGVTRDGVHYGVTVGKDDDGVFVATHRARSKSYPNLDAIPKSALEYIDESG